MKPSGCAKEGDDYLVAWDDLGVGLEFTRVRETDAAIRALVTPVRLEDRRRMLAPVWSSLFEIAARERLAKAISERVEGADAPRLVEWKDSVEQAFGAVIDLHSRPEAPIDLATNPLGDDPGYLIWPVLAKNQVNVFLADQKSGKSYDMLLLCVAISAGLTDLLPAPLKLLGKGPVVYGDSETDKDAQTRRLHRICAGLRLPKLPSIEYIRIRPPFPQQAGHFRRRIDRLGAVFAAVDSLTYAAGGNLNETETAVPMMNAIRELGDSCTKGVTAHYGKQDRKDGAAPSVIGSSTFEFLARNLWLLRRQSEEGERHIDQAWQHRYANDGPLERGFAWRLQFNESNTAVEFSAIDPEQSAWAAKHAGTVEQKIRAALLETEFWKANTNEISKATGLDVRQITRAAGRMDDVRQVAGGRGRSNVSIFELYRTEPGKAPNKMDTPIYRPNVYFPTDVENRLNGQSENRQCPFSSALPEELRDLPF